MKEFENWKNQNCEDKSCPHEASCNGCETIWRAALEMVSRKLKNGEDYYSEGVLAGVEADINEELAEQS